MEKILEDINKAAIKFLVPQTSQQTYKTIVHEAVKLFGANYGSILLEQDGQLQRVYASIKMAYGTENRKRGNTYKSFKEKKVLVVSIDELAKFHPELAEYGVKWTIFIPLSYQKESIGVLTLNTRQEEKIDKSQFHALKLYGTLATLAIIKTKALDETTRALETRDLFISLASHELKTPLTSINGYTQLLLRKGRNQPEFPLKITESLAFEVTRLTNLIKELLEINQVKTGSFQFNWSECILSDIIYRALDNFKLLHPDREIEYSPRVSEKTDIIVGDSDKLLQVTLNLLQNAVKFSPKESIIRVIEEADQKTYKVSIIDEGNGISRKDLPNVFKGFYKGENNTKEGMGLGLFLTKYIIDSHRGMISIKSELGKGTTIEFTLPKATVI